MPADAGLAGAQPPRPHRVTTGSRASAPPGLSTRTVTPGACSATSRAKARGGSTSAAGRRRARPRGNSVPQWIGTAMRGAPVWPRAPRQRGPCGRGRASAPTPTPAATRRRCGRRAPPCRRRRRCHPRSTRSRHPGPRSRSPRRPLRPAPGAAAVVDRGDGADPRAADGRLLADGQFAYTREPEPLEEGARAPRHVHRDRPVEPPQGRDVEVVAVQVRDQDRVEVGRAAGSGDGPWRRRCAMRSRRSGSVSRRAPPISRATVAWPSQVSRSSAATPGSSLLAGRPRHHPRGSGRVTRRPVRVDAVSDRRPREAGWRQARHRPGRRGDLGGTGPEVQDEGYARVFWTAFRRPRTRFPWSTSTAASST